MAIFPTKIHDEYNASNHMEFVMDQDSDVSLLPGLETCAPGSKATSIESGKAFYLTTFGFWTKSTKALVTEELRVDKPGTYMADEGKAFNPVIVADVGNPNYVETIEGTLANPWGGIDIEALGLEINNHDDAHIIMEMTMGTSSARMAYFRYEASPISIFANQGTIDDGDSVVLAAYFVWDGSGALTEGVMFQGNAEGGTFTDLLPMAQQITTVTTIYHHPMNGALSPAENHTFGGNA